MRRLLFFTLTCLISATSFSQSPYCAPEYIMGCSLGDQITSFSTSGGTINISNNSSGCSAGAYSFISEYHQAAAGDMVNFTIALSPASGYRIWVDWNQNNQFDPSEQVFSSNFFSLATTGSFQIPVSQATDAYRMRVRSAFAAEPSDPCANYSHGEVEDYLLVVEDATAPIQIATTGNLSIPCYGGTTDLSAVVFNTSSSSSITWSNGDTGSTSTYSDGSGFVVVDDNAGTVDTSFFQVVQNDEIINNISVTAQPLCGGDSTGVIQATTSGGTPYSSGFTYAWENGDSTAIVDSLTSGWISVIITDSLGCSITDSIEVIGLSTMTATPTVTPATNGNNGAIDLTVTGGTPPYSFDWAGLPDTTASIDNLLPATYAVTITDANGCFIIESIQVGTVGIDEYNQLQLVIYPNPNQGTFHVESAVNTGEIRIFNSVGAEVYRTPITETSTLINAEHLDSGVYIISVTQELQQIFNELSFNNEGVGVFKFGGSSDILFIRPV